MVRSAPPEVKIVLARIPEGCAPSEDFPVRAAFD